MNIRTILVDGEEFEVKTQRYVPANALLRLVHKRGQWPYRQL